MASWEYRILEYKQHGMASKMDVQEMEQEINQLGLQGWEIIKISHNMVNGFSSSMLIFLKRPR